MKRNVAIFGDSILRGVIIDEENGKYKFSDHIDWEFIEDKLNIKNLLIYDTTARA